MLFPIPPHQSHKTDHNQVNVGHNFWSVQNFNFKPCTKFVIYNLLYFNALKVLSNGQWNYGIIANDINISEASGA